jgi:hypothetical protein
LDSMGTFVPILISFQSPERECMDYCRVLIFLPSSISFSEKSRR